MRTRQEIEADITCRKQDDISRLTIELLLDIRGQNAQLLSLYSVSIENERDALLKESGVQTT